MLENIKVYKDRYKHPFRKTLKLTLKQLWYTIQPLLPLQLLSLEKLGTLDTLVISRSKNFL